MKPAIVLFSNTKSAAALSKNRLCFSNCLFLIFFLNIFLSITPIAAQTDSININESIDTTVVKEINSNIKIQELVHNNYLTSQNHYGIPTFKKNILALTNSTTGLQFLHNSDSSNFTSQQIKKRMWLIAGANVVCYSGIMVALSAAWYKGYPKSSFHFFDDHKEWLQADKVGHFYSAYVESSASSDLWKWTGVNRKARIWLGGLSGAVYQTVIETLDGFSAKWGWSWSDFAANILGSGTFIAQELGWKDQRIKLKWSFHRKNYKEEILNQRSNDLFGKTAAERFLKDYNGQTYWASVSIKSFFPKSKFPEWLSVAVGYGAEGMFGGESNIAKDENGNIVFNRSDIPRYRQWYLSPDIDFSRIKTKSKAVRFLFTVLNAFKFPFPSIEFSKKGIRLHAIHF